MKLGRLTPKQEAQIPLIRDEFLNYGLSTEPADFESAEQAVKDAYISAGLEPPKIFIHVDSPYQGAIAAAILKSINLRPQICSQVFHLISEQITTKIRYRTELRLWAQIWSQVGGQVRDKIINQIEKNWIQIGNKKRAHTLTWSAFFGQHEAACIAWASYFHRVCGLPGIEKVEPLARITSSCGWVWFFSDVAIITDRPCKLQRDEQNRLHCENGPALEYRDGFAIYAWHGTIVPPHWIKNKDTLDPNEVIKVDNVEQRAVGAAIVGWPKMLSVLKARTIDKHDNPDIGELIEITLPGLPEPGLFLKARCPRNGIIVEGVPRVSEIDGLPIDTALAAQAWRVGDPQSEYIHPPRRT